MRFMMPLVIGVVADCKMIGLHPFHAVGDKYLRGITEGMDAVPLMIPAMSEPRLLSTYLGMIDGLLLTGSPSKTIMAVKPPPSRTTIRPGMPPPCP